jgi:ATP-dependent DNA helicase RecG
MSSVRDVALVDELRALPAETPWVEFKGNNTDPDMIGKRCSALSNAARIEGKDCAYMLWGIADDSHAVIGTEFNPEAHKAHGQVFQLWLANCLQPSIAFGFRVVAHPAGRVVLLEIPAATGAPVAFNSIAYIRIGSATPKLTDYPERYQQLIERMQPYRWEQGIARQYASGDDVLRLLDYSQYFRLTRQPLPDNRTGIFDKLEGDRLIVRDVGERWNITNLGAILFANRLPDFEASLARKAVRFVAYAGKNRAATVTHRHDGQKGYAVGFEGLVGYINDLLPKNEHIGAAMNEAETRAEHIDPALAAAGWGVVEGSRIRREYPITLGRLEGHGKRGKPLIADYVLEYRNTKLGVVEAKAWDKPSPKASARPRTTPDKLAMRFTYASNGQGIYGIDMQDRARGRTHRPTRRPTSCGR